MSQAETVLVLPFISKIFHNWSQTEVNSVMCSCEDTAVKNGFYSPLKKLEYVELGLVKIGQQDRTEDKILNYTYQKYHHTGGCVHLLMD